LEMYVLAQVIQDMLAIGIENIRNEMDLKAQLLYEFLDTSKSFSAFVQQKEFRSQSILVADIQKVKGDVKKNLAGKGLIVGSGYGKFKETQIRIANCPAHSVKDIKRLISELKKL